MQSVYSSGNDIQGPRTKCQQNQPCKIKHVDTLFLTLTVLIPKKNSNKYVIKVHLSLHKGSVQRKKELLSSIWKFCICINKVRMTFITLRLINQSTNLPH